MKAILMSKENPTGYKLEDLLEQISSELVMKNEKIRHNTGEVSQLIQGNNFEIVRNINRAKALQENNYKILATISKDQGPTGKSRI